MSQRGYLNRVESDSQDAASTTTEMSSYSEDSTKGSPMKHQSDRSHPYELPQLPIEQIEKKIKVQDRMVQEDRECEPTSEVKYQKISIEGEEMCGVPHEDLVNASRYLVELLQLRENYMKLSQQTFSATAGKFLRRHAGDKEESKVEMSKKSSYFCKDCAMSFPNRSKHEKSHAKRDSFDDVPPFSKAGDIQPSQADMMSPWRCYTPERKNYIIKSVDGIFQLYRNAQDVDSGTSIDFPFTERSVFITDLNRMTQLISDGPLKSFCFRRLSYLSLKFQLHVLLNELRELAEQRSTPHRDFYNIWYAINTGVQVPLLNLAVSGIFSAIIALLFDLEKLVEFMSIGTLLAYTIVSASVIILRYKVEQPSDEKTPKEGDDVSITTETSQSEYLCSSSVGKLKPEFWWLSNIVGGCGHGETISGSVFVYICCCAVLSIHLHFSANDLLEGEWWAILVLLFLVACSSGCLLLIAAHRQNPSANTFRVPWVPLVPGLSILFNVGLMVHLNALTWVRFAVWMTLGLLVYFLYGIKHSKEGNQTNTYSMLITTSEANKEPWGSMSPRDGDVKSPKDDDKSNDK